MYNPWVLLIFAFGFVALHVQSQAEIFYAIVGTNVARMSSTGVFTPIAGGSSLDGLAFDKQGNLYYGDFYGGVKKISTNGTVSTFANLPYVEALAFATNGDLYAAQYDPLSSTVWKVTPEGIVSSFATGFSGGWSFDFDKAGNLYIPNGNIIQKVTPTGQVSDFVGGTWLYAIGHLAIDTNDVLYVTSYNDIGGTPTTYLWRFYPDGHPEQVLRLPNKRIGDIGFDKAGNLYLDGFDDGIIYRLTSSGTSVGLISFALIPQYSREFIFSSNPVPDPYFDLPPTDFTAEIASDVQLRVRAVGSSPITYQWFTGTNSISNATNSVLNWFNLQPGDAGTYRVVATDLSGSTTSAPVQLAVIPPVPRKRVPGLQLGAMWPNLLSVERITSSSGLPGWNQLASLVHTNIGGWYEWFFDVTEPMASQAFYRLKETNTSYSSPSINLAMVQAIELTGSVGEHKQIDYMNQFGPLNSWTNLASVTLSNASQLYFDLNEWGQGQTPGFGQPLPRVYRVLTVP